MKRLALVLLMLSAAPSAAHAQDATCQPEVAWGPARQDFAKRVVELVNAHRAGIGRPPLGVSRSLTRAALWKSRHMHRFQYFEHQDPAPPVDRSPSARMQACGYGGGGSGENIASGQTSPEEVVTGWLNSPGHRENIERPEFTQIGVGVAGATGLYWTQNFGTDALTDPNAPPSALPDTLRVAEDAAAVRVDVLANDGDDDKGWAYVGAATGATVADDGLALRYAPPKDFNGRATVPYTLLDLAGESAAGTLTVTVTPVNDAPVARKDRLRLRRRASGATVRVTANDSDVDGDALKVTIRRRPLHGSARVLSGGRIRYRPRSRRRDSLVYRITDPSGARAQATLTISPRR